MATGTMSLYQIINHFSSREDVELWFKSYNLSDYLTEEQISSITKQGIWTKDKLAKKIVDNYLMREIGFETMALFKHKVKIEMERLMEYYLPLIYSSSIQYDPLVNVDFIESFTRNIDSNGTNIGESNSESNSLSSGLTVSSNTPQGEISKQRILQGDYASQTSASESEANSNDLTTTKNNAVSNTQETYSKRTKGNSGVSATAQKMVEQYRQNIYAIDSEIIDKLNKLFYSIF